MYHVWKKILNVLVYCGATKEPPKKQNDYHFATRELETPFTVRIRVGDEIVPVFHARDSYHAKRFRRDHTLQSGYQYV
jgi:hypothetical protein